MVMWRRACLPQVSTIFLLTGSQLSRTVQQRFYLRSTYPLCSGADSSSTNNNLSSDSNTDTIQNGTAAAHVKAAVAEKILMQSQPHLADSLEGSQSFFIGKASIRGTKSTVERSTVFETWHSKSTVGWYLSKLGCNTNKCIRSVMDSEDSLQLQVIKGVNVFTFDSSVINKKFQRVMGGLIDVMHAFELERSGVVFVGHVGGLRQEAGSAESGQYQISNTKMLKSRLEPVSERVTTSSMPATMLNRSMRFDAMTDFELKRQSLRRVSPGLVAGLTPKWLEAATMTLYAHLRLECIDVLLVDYIETILDDETLDEKQQDEEIASIVRVMESQVAQGTTQYYGFSSHRFAPAPKKVYNEYPADALVPEEFKSPYRGWKIIDLYRLMKIVYNVAGKNHHCKFISYPFNLTEHQALSEPLSYEPHHTLKSLAAHLGLTTLGTSPIETKDQQDQPQRYHKFPISRDITAVRNSFAQTLESMVGKDVEIRPFVEKMNPPVSISDLCFGSKFMTMQWRLTNIFEFDAWWRENFPAHRRALQRVRESAASASDVKDWTMRYQQFVDELQRIRTAMFEHRHGSKAIEVSHAIDRLSPTLRCCPLDAQKAITFASHGADVTVSGFHDVRYFHEATQLNPLLKNPFPRKGAEGPTDILPLNEVKALCGSNASGSSTGNSAKQFSGLADAEVSYSNVNPPHPYMLDPLGPTKRKFGPPRKIETLQPIDTSNPKYPDVPEQLDAPGAPIRDTDVSPGPRSSVGGGQLH